MFAAFASHERYQPFSLFDFIAGPESDSRQLAALNELDFETFTALHYGSSQAARLAGALRRAYEAFQKLNPA